MELKDAVVSLSCASILYKRTQSS